MITVEFKEDDDTVIVSKEVKVEVGITRMTKYAIRLYVYLTEFY